MLGWAFVMPMNECSDEKGVGGLLNSQATSQAGDMSCSGASTAGIRRACPCLPPSGAVSLWCWRSWGERSCCALEHPGLWELPAVYSRDNRKTLKLRAPLGKSLPTSGKLRQTKSSFPVPCSLLAPVDLGIWWGLLWPSSPSLSRRQILAPWVRKSLDSRWPQGSALLWQRDAVSQLFDAIFQLSEAAASCPTCSSVLQESQGNSSSHYISENCLSNTPLMS